MQKYKLTITLLSDLCAGSGEGNGVNVDITSSYDDYGLPYIGARRIKGVLRDHCEFLKNHQYSGVTSDRIDKLFGTPDIEGLISIANAEIKGAREIKACLDREDGKILNSKMIQRAYSTQRYNIEVEESGITKEKSLRLISAVPEGTVFESEVVLDISDTNAERDELISLFENSVKLMRGIGMSRNRGFGEVSCKLDEVHQEVEQGGELALEIGTDTKEISYVLKLREPVISDRNYISGSAVQGYFFTELAKKGKDLAPYFSHLSFSPAYPYKNGRVYYPSPFGLVEEKLEAHLKEGAKTYSLVDGYSPTSGVQYVKFGSFYRIEGETIYKTKVEETVDYHFNKEKKDIFTIESLKQGQCFAGSIRLLGENSQAETELLKDIYDVVKEGSGLLKLGASSNNQYGGVEFSIRETDLDHAEPVSGREFVLEFLADAIYLDSFGVNKVGKSALEELVRAIFGRDLPIELKDIQMSTLSIAGYNRKWGLPKRRYQAFSAGTQLRVGCKSELSVAPKHYVGILNDMGYGEVRVRGLSPKKEYILSEEASDDNGAEGAMQGETSEVYRDFKDKVLYKSILEEVWAEAEEKGYKDILKSGLTSSNAMKLGAAHRAVEFKEYYLTALETYVNENYKGKNTDELRKFINSVMKDLKQKIENKTYEKSLSDAFYSAKRSELDKTYMTAYLVGMKRGTKERDSLKKLQTKEANTHQVLGE